jgi:hypothetical protein
MASPVAGSRAATSRPSRSSPEVPLARVLASTRSATARTVWPARAITREPGCGKEGGNPSEVSASFHTE